MIRLNLGCGIWLRKGFINVDNSFDLEQVKSKKAPYENAIIERGAKYVRADIKSLPFPDNYADSVEMHDVIEHFPMWHVIDYMKEVCRVMKPGAKIIIQTPLFTGLAIDWLRMVATTEFNPETYASIAETIYGNQYADNEGEVHRTPFTPQFLNYVLTSAGFGGGEMWIVTKGTPFPKVGTRKAKPGWVARCDYLICEGRK